MKQPGLGQPLGRGHLGPVPMPGLLVTTTSVSLEEGLVNGWDCFPRTPSETV